LGEPRRVGDSPANEVIDSRLNVAKIAALQSLTFEGMNFSP
jgi:hypothetical protein